MDINLIVDQLLSIAEFLASEAFKMAMRQIQLKAILDGVTVLIAVVCLIILNVKTGNFQRKVWNDELDDWSPDSAGLAIFTIIMVNVILSITAWINLYCVISYMYNPQWYAVKLLIDTLITK